MSDFSEIFSSHIDGNEIKIKIESKNVPRLLTALKLLELEIENLIIGANQPKVDSSVEIPDSLLKNIRG